MKRFKNLTYYQRLLLILSVFIFVFVIPYSIGLYSFSKKEILKSIQTSNDQSLTQIKSNYSTFNDTMKSVCFSVYLNNETKNMLYNPDITYQESTEYINYLKTTVLNTNPSVYSILLYNGTQERYYSTLTDSSKYVLNLGEFMESDYEPPKLQPILRKIPHIARDSYVYVFSYILYDYIGEDGKPFSYIVLEQNASWMMENFSKINQSSDYIPSRIYLLDKDGEVCSETPSDISDLDIQLLNRYHSHQTEDVSEDDDNTIYYTEKIDGKKYLVTGLQLNKNLDSIVLLQDYDDVFANLESFRNTFQIILLIWCILLLAAVFGISKRLYAPVKDTLSYIGDLSGADVSDGDEFQQMMKLYKDSYDKQMKHTQASRQAIRQYQLIRLMTDYSSLTLKNFMDFSPDHWLVQDNPGFLRLILTTFHKASDLEKSLSDEDFNLFLFASQNILTELLEKDFSTEVFSTSDHSIWCIVRSESPDIELMMEDIIEESKTYIKKFMSLQMDASYSRSADKVSQLNVLYNELLIQHKYHYVIGPDAIIGPMTCRKNFANTSGRIPDNMKKKLTNHIKCDHAEEAVTELKKIFGIIREMPYENVQTCVMTVVNQINYTLKEMCVSRGVASAMHFDALYQELDTASYLEELENYLIQYLTDTLKMFQEKNELNKQEMFAEEIRHYIDENYSDPNLSSQMLAEHLNLSAKYVMKKFQEHTGGSLNDYITEVRMRQAAVLLMNSHLPVSKISQQVGITNENYFYKLFKKIYGCTPREFSAQSDANK